MIEVTKAAVDYLNKVRGDDFVTLGVRVVAVLVFSTYGTLKKSGQTYNGANLIVNA